MQEQNSTSSSESDSSRQCWVCLATENDDPSAAWIKPCRCKGTSQWVHVCCLQRWIDEKQKGNAFGKVSCPQCGTQYLIVYPSVSKLLLIVTRIDEVVMNLCPFATAGIVLVSIYWTAVSYGAVTLMEILGYKEAMDIMEQCEPLSLAFGLPAIPVALLCARMIRWEDYLLNFTYYLAPKIRPVLHADSAYTNSAQPEQQPGVARMGQREVQVQVDIAINGNSITRAFFGALALPTIAMLCGRVLFRNYSQAPVTQALLGGTAFIIAKGVLKIYRRHQQLVQRSQRRIEPFPGQNEASAQVPDVSDRDN